MSTSMGSETVTRKIAARLKREGWTQLHGGKHDKFEHPAKPGLTLIVPRHREVSPGVARDIAQKAGWI
jgi:predicted RNA binding protein YcfA (HicA-like mRNA interferase family)